MLARAVRVVSSLLLALLTVWAIYTGVVAYVLVGTLFLAEYAIRKLRFG